MNQKARRTTILVIDDQEDITRALKLGLEHHGIATDTFNDPLEALERFKAGVYDLVLVDIRMPRMNGFLVYRKIRAVDESVPICFLTAFNIYDTEFGRLFPDMKVQGLLKKPIRMRDLLDFVQRNSKVKEEQT